MDSKLLSKINDARESDFKGNLKFPSKFHPSLYSTVQ